MARRLARWRAEQPRLIGCVLLIGVLSGCAATPPYPGELSDPGDPEAGQLILDDGTELSIRPADLRLTGRAEYHWPDGQHYRGDFVDGLPHGTGRQTLPSGEHYRGQWQDGVRHGQGMLQMPDGSRYVGEFAAGQRHGEGRFESRDGVYEGSWANGSPEGQGRFEYADGSIYEGHWEQGRRNGPGRYRAADGARYEGDWYNDVPHGFGEIQEPDDYHYEGGWAHGRRHGYGVMSVGEALRYEGTWVTDQRQGYGRETRVDGTTYEGEWYQDRRHGRGVAQLPDGSLHDGEWREDRPLGPGTRRLSNSIQISGFWTGNQVPAGILSLPQGDDYAGTLYGVYQHRVSPELVDWLRVRAERGHPHAQLMLGDAYRNYQDPEPDKTRAEHWYRQAAQQGLTEASFQLGRLYLEMPDRRSQALPPLRAAAAQQHPAANLLLGRLYESGNLVSRNAHLAADHYRSASDLGNLEARHRLAWLLATSADETLRHAERSLTLIRPVAILFDDWQYLETLAAAQAATGDYDAAVATQRLALRQAHSRGDAQASATRLADMESRLTLYRAGQAYVSPD